MTLSRMEFFGYHGVFAEENKLGQRFYVDVALCMPLAEAGKTDDLELTINYAEIHKRVQEITEKRVFRLIEALAEQIAADLLEAYSLIEEVTVRVTKPHPPFKIYFEGVTVEIRRKRPAEVYIGLGSNIGDREAYLREAVRLLEEHPDIRVKRCSSVYETDPVAFTDQDAFLNMAVSVETQLSPHELLAYTLETEQRLGRKREVRWGPRTIDLDLLSYGKQVLHTPGLTIPHAELRGRAFVLIPLSEIADDGAVPGILSLSEHLRTLEGKEGVRLWKTNSDWLSESGPSGN